MNGAPAAMSGDEIEMWTRAAEDLRTPLMLGRIGDHNKAVISTVATVGTLLAGLGGVTAGISITRSTLYYEGWPVVPVGALAASVLAGTAVAIALFGRRPEFSEVNTNNLLEVKEWYLNEVDRGRTTVRLATNLFIASAVVAVITSLLAGGLAIINAQSSPRNLATLAATFGEGSVVTLQLEGAVDGLDEGEHVTVAVEGNAPESIKGDVINATIYPDDTGKATVDLSAQAPVGSTEATAIIQVLKEGEAGTTDYTLKASYPKVPQPELK